MGGCELVHVLAPAHPNKKILCSLSLPFYGTQYQ